MKNIDHDALEELLRQASPRPVPSPEEEAAVRGAVRAEWTSLTSQRRTRQRVARYAIAATVLLGVFAAFNALRAPVAEVVRVATIEKSTGSVYLLGERSELRETLDLSNILSGQTIVTGKDAGLALAWSKGGSIRVDENSRIKFADDESVFLLEGRVYFDSSPSSRPSSRLEAGIGPIFILRTELGEIQHLGTQYMSEIDSDTLIVSVREGEVSINGKYHDRKVLSGQQAMMSGRQQPSILSISRSGEAWNWVNRTTPPVEVEGWSMYEFLVWACRELGLELRFEGDAEAEARKAELKGTIDIQPADALRLRLASAALDWRIDEGVIYIQKGP